MNFLMLIEIMTYDKLRALGVSAQKITLAYRDIAENFQLRFPFSHGGVLCDGRNISVLYNIDQVLRADRSKQLELHTLVASFYKRIEFDVASSYAARYWPLGRDGNIVVDPNHAFGLPVVEGTNIRVDSVWSYLQAGESPNYIADLYDIDLACVRSTQDYFSRAAA